MPLIKNRRLKIKWQILLAILPFAFVQFIIILLFIRFNLLTYEENQKFIVNITLPLFIISFIIFVFLIIIFIKISNLWVYPLKRLNYVANKVSQGYLDIDLTSESKDEIGHLYRTFNKMIKSHIEILANVQISSNDLSGYQITLNKIVENFDVILKRQATSMSGSLKIFEKFDHSIMTIIQNTKDANGIIEETQKHSDYSTDIINEMTEEINQMADTGRKISLITDVIHGISEKTRLLSINSAIEASRAGDVGRGFAVVSSEIKQLALQSKEAVTQIGELIRGSDKRISAGINKTLQVIEMLRNINSGIKMIAGIVDQINFATQEESRTSRDIMDINNSFFENVNKNLKLMTSLEKIKNVFDIEIEKIRKSINTFILKGDKREVVKDIKILTKEEMEKIRIERKNYKTGQKAQKREMEEKKKIEKMKEKRSDRLDTVRAISLYKPKKSIFDIFKK